MTDTRNIAIGATVYSQHGQEAELVARTGGEYIVRPIYEDDDGPRAGDVETWREVFRTPPAPKLDEETALAEKRLTELRAQISAVEAQRREFDRDEKARKERVQRHEALAELDRYLAGEITHYVTVSDYNPTVEILPVTETIERHSSSNSYGMLTLYPCNNWHGLQWLLNYLPNGSRSYESRTTRVHLCCGEEAAKAKAAEVLRGFIADMLAKEPAKRYDVERLISSCHKHGVDVPQELIDHVESQRVAQLEKELADHKAKIAVIEQKLAGS